MHTIPEPALARFTTRIAKTDTCWNWTGSIDRGGYGRLKVNGRYITAHRIAYTIHNGEPKNGLVIDHICHNRTCVNPQHLRAITQKQNLENRAGAQANNHTSGVLGVTWKKNRNKWVAQVMHHGKQHHCGYFNSVKEAAEAAKAKRLELFTCNNADH